MFIPNIRWLSTKAECPPHHVCIPSRDNVPPITWSSQGGPGFGGSPPPQRQWQPRHVDLHDSTRPSRLTAAFGLKSSQLDQDLPLQTAFPDKALLAHITLKSRRLVFPPRFIIECWLFLRARFRHILFYFPWCFVMLSGCQFTVVRGPLTAPQPGHNSLVLVFRWNTGKRVRASPIGPPYGYRISFLFEGGKANCKWIGCYTSQTIWQANCRPTTVSKSSSQYSCTLTVHFEYHHCVETKKKFSGDCHLHHGQKVKNH